MTNNLVGPVQPWWRIRMMWVALGGPAVVVVAGFVTLFLAVNGRDIPLAETARADTGGAITHVPAHQARGHAATAGR
ncbi:MAG: hypothetical protein RLZZ618_1218 [Pseudomonadota bacterium]|jgi:hypothetical protein